MTQPAGIESSRWEPRESRGFESSESKGRAESLEKRENTTITQMAQTAMKSIVENVVQTFKGGLQSLQGKFINMPMSPPPSEESLAPIPLPIHFSALTPVTPMPPSSTTECAPVTTPESSAAPTTSFAPPVATPAPSFASTPATKPAKVINGPPYAQIDFLLTTIINEVDNLNKKMLSGDIQMFDIIRYRNDDIVIFKNKFLEIEKHIGLYTNEEGEKIKINIEKARRKISEFKKIASEISTFIKYINEEELQYIDQGELKKFGYDEDDRLSEDLYFQARENLERNNQQINPYTILDEVKRLIQRAKATKKAFAVHNLKYVRENFQLFYTEKRAVHIMIRNQGQSGTYIWPSKKQGTNGEPTYHFVDWNEKAHWCPIKGVVNLWNNEKPI